MDNLLYADGITLIVNQQQLMDRIVNEYRNHNDENLIITLIKYKLPLNLMY